MKRILITGAGGALGRELTPRLIAAGWKVRGLGRHPSPFLPQMGVEWAQVDLATGEGLAEAVSGVEAVIHAASSPFVREREIDIEGTGRLLDACRSAEVGHFVYVSIVGIDRVPLGYYRSKLAAEKLVEQGGVAWSILRATQFHSLIDRTLKMAPTLPVLAIPTSFQFQAIDEGEVADRLVEIVGSAPAGRLDDIGGPEARRLGDLARKWLAARRERRLILPLPVVGKVHSAYRKGLNTCPDKSYGKITWEQWLERKYPDKGNRG